MKLSNIDSLNKITRFRLNKASLGWLAVVFVIVLFAEFFVYTWCRVQYVNLGYEIEEVSERRKELTSIQNRLKIEMEHLKSPDRIAKIARWHIGLDNPGPQQMIIIQ